MRRVSLRAFSLIEVMIAVVIITVGAIGAFMVYSYVIATNHNSRKVVDADLMAQSYVNHFMSDARQWTPTTMPNNSVKQIANAPKDIWRFYEGPKHPCLGTTPIREKYCVALYVKSPTDPTNINTYSGYVRVYWSKNRNQICNSNHNASNLGMITLPFTIRRSN